MSTRARVRTRVPLPLRRQNGLDAQAELITFTGLVDAGEHFALVLADALEQIAPLVRVHSECLTGDVLGSARCDCGPQLQECLDLMSDHGGVVLYLRQEGRGIGLYNKIDAYRLQDEGLDTFEANRALDLPEDARDFHVAAQMLEALGVTAVDLLTNNPDKTQQLAQSGIRVRRVRGTSAHLTLHNRRYLTSKVERGHRLNLVDRPVDLRLVSGPIRATVPPAAL